MPTITGKTANALSRASLAALSGDLFSASKPGLTPALMKAMEVLAGGGSKGDATKSALAVFAHSPAGKAAGAKALKALGPILDALVKRPLLASHWGQLTKFAAKPGAFKPLTELLVKALGKPCGTALGSFTRQVVRAATGKGFEAGIKVATKQAPRVLSVLGKFGKLIPGLGLVGSLVSAVRVFANPNSTGLQKFAALLDVTAGVVGVIPGIGTAVQVGLSVAATGAGFAADALAPAQPKPVVLEPKDGDFLPQSPGAADIWR